MRTGSCRVLGGVAVAVLVLSGAACGGGGGNGGGGHTTTSTAAGGTSADAWATGVCSSVAAWQKSLESIKSDVTSNPSSSQIRQAGRELDRATQTLTRSLKQLGKPETAQGEAAKKSLDSLAATLQSGMDKIDEALKSGSSGAGGALSQISTISATLATMASSLKLAGGNLKQLAPSGELQHAFQQASACQQLTR
jgi:DNA repair exonuclease SbcCD ATPase subunit